MTTMQEHIPSLLLALLAVVLLGLVPLLVVLIRRSSGAGSH